MPSIGTVAVCLKWVALRAEVDPLTGAVTVDERRHGASESDLAALEHGLRLAEAWGTEVVALCAGPPGAEAMLRDAVAAGAARAVRVELAPGAPSDAAAAGLAAAARAAGATVLLCGDWSLDRGTGAVPAFLAAELDAAQALGLVELAIDDAPGEGAAGIRAVRAERRLDGGRREQLRVTAPMVLSVEGRLRLRRAPLDRVLAARDATIEVLPAPGRAAAAHEVPAAIGPYRPRPRLLPPPPQGLSARERVLALTGALAERTPPERVTLAPDAAADRILDQLRAWGYLE